MLYVQHLVRLRACCACFTHSPWLQSQSQDILRGKVPPQPCFAAKHIAGKVQFLPDVGLRATIVLLCVTTEFAAGCWCGECLSPDVDRLENAAAPRCCSPKGRAPWCWSLEHLPESQALVSSGTAPVESSRSYWQREAMLSHCV